MTRKIAVIGMGNVGGAVAHQIVATGMVDDLVIIDERTAKSNADALDFADAMANLTHHTNVIANDYEAVADAEIVISAVGKVSLQSATNPDRFAELEYTSTQVKHVARNLKRVGFHGKIICISNPCDIMTTIYQQITGLPYNHVVGTGTMLDSARMRRAVGHALDVDPRSVTGYNLGEHGNSQFTAWSTVRILGHPVTELVDSKHLDLDAIDEDSRIGGFTVFKGKQYTNYAIAAAATRLARTVLEDAHTELAVSNWHEEFNSYLSTPVIIGRDGVLARAEFDLTKEEENKLAQSAQFIRQHYAEVDPANDKVGSEA